MKTTPLTARIPEASALTGIPKHIIQKSFMSPEKRPRGIPAPPPHIRINRAIHILVAELPGWVASLGNGSTVSAPSAPTPRRRGRPTKAEVIARRQRGEG
jgi:hypothetical protein